MVDPHVVEKQLKRLKYDTRGWNRAEVKELPKILVDDEEIYEVANGTYEGGFALLVATNIRVLLVDKKPLNFLTVEDLRFDMINEIDYSHRLMGATISISTGSKNLKFRSYNQPRLRKLITHVQHCMAETKMKQNEHQEDQKSHLEQINHQLQAYLIAQHQQQMQFQQQMQQGQQPPANAPEPIKPSPELADFLYAQGLLAQYRDQADPKEASVEKSASPEAELYQKALPAVAAPTPNDEHEQRTIDEPPQPVSPEAAHNDTNNPQLADLYEAGREEIFGKHQQLQAEAAADTTPGTAQSAPAAAPSPNPTNATTTSRPLLEVNSLRIAYSKLPMALRNRRFGRPSFHAHSQAAPTVPPATAAQ